MNLRLSLLPLILISYGLLSISGCEKFKFNRVDEGKLIYDINYETSKEENPIIVLLPKQMITFFKDNMTNTEIQGYFGAFKLSFLTRPNLNKKYTLLRILDKKFIYETTLDGKVFGTDEMKDLQVFLIDTTFIYKKLKCKLAKAYCPTISPDTFDIIYTNQIKINNPNINTPFQKIPGVLIKSKLRMFGIVMNIELVELKQEKIDSKIFEIPKNNYKYINYEELNKIVKSFQE